MIQNIRPQSYEVLISPMQADGTYGALYDVSKTTSIDDYIKENGISTILQECDNGDFDFGVFSYSSIKLTCINYTGLFSGPNDSRSIFRITRDKAKVVINFYDGISNTPHFSFKGIIDDRATTINFQTTEVKLTVLSSDSVLNRTKLPAGAIPDGMLISEAIKYILQIPVVANVLKYKPENINVKDDYHIEDGKKLSNKTLKEVMDSLLVVSNSVLVTDIQTDEVIVRSRDHNTPTKILKLYGPNDIFGRENIIKIEKYNTGLQRAFNTIEYGEEIETDAGYVDLFGDNIKRIDYNFITSKVTRRKIAKSLLEYWKAPKEEMEVTVSSALCKDFGFFDLVQIDYKKQYIPWKNSRLPIYGKSKYGEAVYPTTFGVLQIEKNKAFKIIGKEENPNKLTTKLKLRQTGTTLSDGYYNQYVSLYGLAIYGKSVYNSNPYRINPNINSVYGAALYGTCLYRKR